MMHARFLARAAAGLLLAAALFVASGALARSTPEALPDIATSALPSEAREVMASIRTGGPFRFERDGVVFGNRERILPPQGRGYYHEYTVHTPGTKSRGSPGSHAPP